MKVFNIVIIFIYSLIFCITGSVLIALSLRMESIDSLISLVGDLSHAENIRLWIALAGALLILINISIAQMSIGKLQKHRTIAFENPYGQITVSLAAIEDYIKKLTNNMTEIKEIKSLITAGKAGIQISARTALYSEANIPEVTEKIQNLIRVRLQEMLGVEEKVTIKIHVAKIVRRERGAAEDEDGPGGFKGKIEYGKGGQNL